MPRASPSCRAATPSASNCRTSTRETVYLRELLAADDFDKSKAELPLALGKTIGGEPVIADLAKHAAPADRRHHRLGQVGGDQHHDPVAALPADAGAVPADHDRSEDAGTLGL
ncbi:MAG: hypothetical protein V9F04_08790 [Dermatophilaceae bacterium]